MTEFKYVGSELDLFAGVELEGILVPADYGRFVKGDILEVGAGIGSNTRLLDSDGGSGRWVCLEPDPELLGQLTRNIARNGSTAWV